MVAHKSRETTRRLAITGQPLVTHHQHRGAGDRQVVPEAEFGAHADEYQRDQHDELQAGDNEQVHVPEKDGRRLYAQLDVVFAIAHCIEGVVDHGPDQRRAEHQPGELRRFARLGRKGHRHRPAERRAEKELRYRHVAFDERVDDREYGADDRQLLRLAVQHRREADSNQAERKEKYQRLHRGDRTRRDRAGSRSLHVRIDLAVDPVIQYASRRPHDEDTEHEDHEQALVGTAFTGEPQRPEARPQQQVDADRLVDAHQLAVIAQLRDELGRETGGKSELHCSGV